MTSRYSKLYKPKGAPPSQRSNVITTIKQDMSLQIVWHSILGGRQVKGVIVIRSCKSCPRWTAQSLSSTSPCINSLAMFVSWWGYAITSSKIVLMELLDALASKIFLQGLRCKKNCDHILCWFWLDLAMNIDRLLILYHTEVTINLQDKYLIWFTLLTIEPRLLHWSHWSRRYLKYSKRTWV